MIAPLPLHGLRIMVTRPAHQAARLCALISAAGGKPVVLPALAIEEPRDPAPARALAARLEEFDIAIFVSANAVERGMALIREHGGLPARLTVAAVGRRTAEALLSHGGRIDIQAPPPYNSEALLAETALQTVRGKNIVIFRGEGGRELLADTLRQHGATVVYAEVYRRVQPQVALADMLGRAGEIDMVVVSSQDALRNLMAMAELEHCREWLLTRQLAVIGARIAQLATELGFKHPALVAKQASDEGLVGAMTTWRRGGQAAQ